MDYQNRDQYENVVVEDVFDVIWLSKDLYAVHMRELEPETNKKRF